MKTELILLSESYEKSPIIKSLVQLIPGGGSVDSYLTTKLNNMKAERMKIFFDKLQSGQQELSENIIETNDFLHAYFCTVDYVLRTKSEDKIKRFAEILLGLAANKINFNEFYHWLPLQFIFIILINKIFLIKNKKLEKLKNLLKYLFLPFNFKKHPKKAIGFWLLVGLVFAGKYFLIQKIQN